MGKSAEEGDTVPDHVVRAAFCEEGHLSRDVRVKKEPALWSGGACFQETDRWAEGPRARPAWSV